MSRFIRLLSCLLVSGLCGCAPENLPSVNIFVTSDIEGVFWSRPEPRRGNEVSGGLAILKSFLDQQSKDQETPFLVLEGGNWFSQTPEGTLTQGEYFNQVAASIPYSGRFFTDKDLIYGWGSLSRIIEQSPAPFVLTNVRLGNQQLPRGAQPWLLKNVGSYKIGILSVLPMQTLKGKQRLGGLRILPEVEETQKTVQLLREKGAQMIVVLSALGPGDNQEAVTDRNLAEEVPGIDVIISSNQGRDEAEAISVGKTLIVYPSARLDSVGKIQFSFYKNGELASTHFEDVVLYRKDFGEDRTVALQIADLRRTIRSQMGRPVGKSTQTLSGNFNGESILGDWAADCLRKWAKADAAIINSSSFRGVLPEGTVTQYDLYNLYPYSDHVTYLTIKGRALLEALEEGLKVPDNFAQISGLSITYHAQAPGRKITSVLIDDKPLALESTYRVAVTDYMLAGGAGHDGFIDSLEFKNTQVEMNTILRLCLAGKNAVTAPTGSRWKVKK